MEKKNQTQAGVGRELTFQLSDAANSERNRIYPPSSPGLARLGLLRFDFSELLKGGEQNMTIDTKFVDERVNHYIQLFETIRNKVGDDHLAVALLEQCGRDMRVAQMRSNDRAERRVSTANHEAPASDRQLAFLGRLNVKNVPKNLSMAQASRMIDEAQARELAM